MATSKRQKLIFAHIALIIAILIWGSTYFVIKDSLNGIHPVTLVFYRFLIATIIMGVILAISRKNPLQGLHHGMHLGMMLWLLYIPQTVGLMYVSASSSGFITSLYILFIPIISAIFLKAKISGQRQLSILLAIVGLYFVTGGIDKISLGDSFTLIAAVAIGFQYLLVDHYLRLKADPFVLCFQQFFFLTICTLITIFLVKAPLTIDTTNSLYDLIYLSIFPSVVAYLLMTKSQLYISPMTVSIFGVLEPISAAIFAWTLGGEKILLGEAIGGIIIIAGILLAEVQVKKKFKFF